MNTDGERDEGMNRATTTVCKDINNGTTLPERLIVQVLFSHPTTNFFVIFRFQE